MQTRMGYGLGLGMTRGMTAAVAWLPSALFAASEQGVWYDPSDFSTMYQDNLGVTPVTAVGQTVGFLGDKSKGYTLGAELVTNGDFSDGATGWTVIGANVAISGGKATWTSAPPNERITQGSLDTAKTYRVTFTISDYVSGAVYHLNGETAVGAAANGTYTSLVTGASSIYIRAGGAGFTGSVTDISVRELPGNHATQATAASRPVLGRVPFGGRRNLLTYTEQFDNAAWGKFVGWAVSANATAAPVGTTTADAIIPTAGTNLPYTRKVITVAATAHEQSVYVKKGVTRWVQLLDANQVNTRAWFDLDTGSVGTQQASVTSANMTALADDWYRIDIGFTKTNTTCEFAVQPASADNSMTHITWNGTDAAFYLWGAQLETGSTATAYQKVVTDLDVTEAGVADCYYLMFDGTDDFLVTGNIDFSATDEMTVCAGVRKLATAVGIIGEVGDTSGVSGSIATYTNGSSYWANSRGTTERILATTATFAPPVTNLLTVLSKISTPSLNIRTDGASNATSALTQGTGNLANAPLYIGRRAGLSLPFNGHLYSLVVRGNTTTGDLLTNLEGYVANETGVTL